jgi:diaminohydroxyphosphoribosylaminopyrimidine deaminase/5-amino-6-(5-phosphoribosylamino)uracil reductase
MTNDHSRFMLRALEIARRGQGYVEPNPMVGCVIVSGGQIVGEGWHQYFGGAHAEINALAAAGERARGATMYVTLEPCCHHGKTPPCTEAIIPAGIKRVVVAMRDPFPQVAGDGILQLQAAGIAVEVGLHEAEARELNAPYLKLLQTSRPWIIAKWAMTLDGKLATKSGDSQWITSLESRQIVHSLRARVDAVLVGRGTAQIDDPLLTARMQNAAFQGPALAAGQQGPISSRLPRVAARIVLDSLAQLRSDSQLVRTARDVPTLVACGPDAPPRDVERLNAAGCEVLSLPGNTHKQRLLQLLDELGRRRLTNVLVEGGAKLQGSLFDIRQIDEVHTFIGPKLFGGHRAPSPLGGEGIDSVDAGLSLSNLQMQSVGPDVYLHGRVQPVAVKPTVQ